MPPLAIARSVCSAISRSPRREQELDHRRGGELRRARREAAVLPVVAAAQRRRRRRRARPRRARPRPAEARRRRPAAADDACGRTARSRRAARATRRPRPRARLRPRRHAVARLGREVGAGVERHAVGGEERVERPAAVAGHRLHGVHVDRVDVRALLAVDLDADEVLVHQRGDLRVLEGLALHHVAPVARGVADRDEDRLVLAARARRSASSPHGYQSTGFSACWSR